ncbi:MAG: hypothetical protein AVDCRST_MAG17-1314, partial [uncultured Solirubrobacterales bacterium]
GSQRIPRGRAQRRAACLAAADGLSPPRPLAARASAGGHRRVRSGDQRLCRARAPAHERARGPGVGGRGVPAVDAGRVLDAPRGPPLRARARPRSASALDVPRRPPRPPQQPGVRGRPADRQRPARRPVRRALLSRARRPGLARGHRGLHGGVPDLRRDPLPPASATPADAPGPGPARAAHAPPLPGRQPRLRRDRALLGPRVRHRTIAPTRAARRPPRSPRPGGM